MIPAILTHLYSLYYIINMSSTTYSIADARRDFAEIVSRVSFAGETVTIKRYGTPVARIIPIVTNVSEEIINKYFGVWKREPWAKTVGKPSRKFRKNRIVS